VVLQLGEAVHLRYASVRTVAAARIIIILIALAAVAVGCEEAPSNVEDAGWTLPAFEGVIAVKVTDERTGTVVRRIDDPAAIEQLLGGLRQAEPSGIDDPEMSGRLLRVTLTGAEGVRTFTVNDLRETDAARYSGKVYIEGEDGRTRAWTVKSAWIAELCGEFRPNDPPLLYLSIANESGSVSVWANRRIRTASAPIAVESTLQVAGLTKDASAPAYRIEWSDAQRFVVRFEELGEGAAVRFRLDGLMTADGETFANADQPRRNEVLLIGRPAHSRALWFDEAGRLFRAVRSEPAALVQPFETEDGPALLAYHLDGSQTAIDLRSGERRAFQIGAWPDAAEPFGNDYGSDVLFSDRMHGSATFAVHGNRTLYRVEPFGGETVKLYESPVPIRSVASSPDGRRVALLVSADGGSGGALTAEADALVLSASGETLRRIPRVTFGGHSDGFLFVLPMRWANDNTIAVRRYDGESDVAWIDANKGTVRLERRPALPEAARSLLEEAVGWPAEIIKTAPLDGGQVAVWTHEGSWLVDAGRRRAVWLGPGEALPWTGGTAFVVWESVPDVRTYDIGMPMP